MTYSALSTYSSGNVPTAAQLNQARDNFNSLRRFNDHGVLLSLSDDFDVLNTTLTPIPWDVVDHQTGTPWSVVQPTRLVAPVAGKYGIIFNAEWRTSSSGERTISVTLSAGSLRIDLESQGSLLGGGNESGIDVIQMAANDYLVCNLYQASGGTIGIRGNGPDRSCVAFWLLGV